MVLSLAFPIIPGVDCLRVMGVGEEAENEVDAVLAAAAADDGEEEEVLVWLEMMKGEEENLSEPGK